MFGKRPIILLLCFIYLCIQLPQTSWHSNTPDSALKMLGEFDLTSGNGLAVTFWHKFDLPPGSIGTVEASADGGLTWRSIYTQTTSVLNWTPVTLDLGAYAGQTVSLAFYLRQIGGESSTQNNNTQLTTIPAQGQTSPFLLPTLLAGSIGIVVMGRKRRQVWVTLMLLGVGILSVNCAGPGPFYDYDRLSQVMGEVELVVPATDRIQAELSPDGRWLWLGHARDEEGNYWVSLIDLEHNLRYDQIDKRGGSNGRWLDNSHLLMEYGAILQVPEMRIWKLQAIEPPSGSLGQLEDAPHIFAADGFAGSPVYWLTSTDPAFPYLIRSSGFRDDAHIFNEELETFLADRPHTIVWRNASVGDSVPYDSDDGQYYIKEWYFDDPTADMWQESSAIFDAMTDEVVAYGYKNAWVGIPLGWASDSSGAYFLFRPASPTGDVLYDKYPIYKILVPGAEKQGLPEPVIITPSPVSQYTLPDADVTWLEPDKGVLSHSLAQASYSGWYIDDVAAIETDPPPTTPTTTATPTITATPTATPDPSYGMCEYREVGGLVVIEAEHYASQTAGNGTAHWQSAKAVTTNPSQKPQVWG